MGIAGRLAQTFLHSKLTPLVTLASLAAGAIAILGTPREEEPQISVPMIDVIAALPGGTPRELENLLVRPIEQQMWEIPGVEHIYSIAGEGMALVTVRFKVGEDQEASVAKVHAKLSAAMDRIPAGATPPIVKPHSIDDVPILALTLYSARYGSDELRRLAVRLEDDLRTIPDVAETAVIGGASREMRVLLDPARLAASGVSPGEVAAALQGATTRSSWSASTHRSPPPTTSGASSSQHEPVPRSTCAMSPSSARHSPSATATSRMRPPPTVPPVPSRSAWRNGAAPMPPSSPAPRSNASSRRSSGSCRQASASRSRATTAKPPATRRAS